MFKIFIWSISYPPAAKNSDHGLHKGARTTPRISKGAFAGRELFLGSLEVQGVD